MVIIQLSHVAVSVMQSLWSSHLKKPHFYVTISNSVLIACSDDSTRESHETFVVTSYDKYITKL